MAIQVRNTDSAVLAALVTEHNALQKDIAANLATYAHYDKTATSGGDFSAPTSSVLQVTAADGAGTLAALRTLCINLWLVYQTHLADFYASNMSGGAHKVADSPPALTAPTTSSTLGALQTFLDALYTDYNTHIGSTTYHPTADGTNVASSAAATNQATSDTRANDIKAKLNAHISSAPGAALIKVIAP